MVRVQLPIWWFWWNILKGHLKIEAVALFETVSTYETAQCHNPETSDLKAFVSVNTSMSFKVGLRCGRVVKHITDSDAEIYFA